jgi:hypothetical protein
MRRVALFAAENSANWVIKMGFEDIVGAFILLFKIVIVIDTHNSE